MAHFIFVVFQMLCLKHEFIDVYVCELSNEIICRGCSRRKKNYHLSILPCFLLKHIDFGIPNYFEIDISIHFKHIESCASVQCKCGANLRPTSLPKGLKVWHSLIFRQVTLLAPAPKPLYKKPRLWDGKTVYGSWLTGKRDWERWYISV